MRATVKDYSDGGAGSFTAVASDGSIDRDDEVVEPGAFEPLGDYVPVHFGHGGPLVAGGTPRYERGRLLVDAKFGSTSAAQEARSLVKDGLLRHLSIVFVPRRTKNVDGRRHITAGELLAADLVTIPSNRGTAVLAARGYWPDSVRAVVDSFLLGQGVAGTLTNASTAALTPLAVRTYADTVLEELRRG